jgi:hypothetical protein
MEQMRLKNRPMRPRYMSFAIAWMGLLAVLSCLPRNDKHLLHTTGRFHDTGHFVAFAGLAYLVTRAVWTTPRRLAVLAGCLAFAGTIELAQGLFYHAAIEWIDVLIDSVAVLTGAAIGWLLHRRTVTPMDEITSSTIGPVLKDK